MANNYVHEIIRAMPRWKKVLWIGLPILATILSIALLLWAFSIPTFFGLFLWVDLYRNLLSIILGICIAVPIFLIVDLMIAKRRNHVIRVPSRALWGLALVGILAPTVLFGIAGIQPMIKVGDKSPQLIVLEKNGINGIPNLAVIFWTQSATKNTIKWGTDSSNLKSTNSETVNNHEHAFILADLLPKTQYFYQINDGTVYNFTTPGNTPNTFKFALSSDAHFGRPISNNTATLKILEQSLNPAHGNEMFFFLGDLVEYGFTESMWTTAINQMSPYTSSMPYRPILGNHDSMGGMGLYRSYINPDSLLTSTEDSPYYYRIDINNIHIFMLELEWGNDSNTAAQQAWFKKQIATVPKDDWTIVMNHALYYTSGIYVDGAWWSDNQPMIENFVSLFEENDVDMVFSGHNHHLEVLQVKGITYAVVGGFGGHLDPIREANGTGSLWYTNEHYGFVEVDIAGNDANMTFLTPEYVQLKSISISK